MCGARREKKTTTCHAHSELWQRRWRNEICSCRHHEWCEDRMKSSLLWTVSSPLAAKPFPRQQLAQRVGPYLRRASRGEALIGDWGGWRLSGWWASLIAILLEGRGLASTKLHVKHTQTLVMKSEQIQSGSKVYCDILYVLFCKSWVVSSLWHLYYCKCLVKGENNLDLLNYCSGTFFIIIF